MFGSNKADIRMMVEVCERIAAGDFDARIVKAIDDPDVRRLANAINDIIDRSDAFVRESAASMRRLSENRYYRRVMPGGFQGGFAFGANATNEATDTIERKVVDFRGVIDGFEATATTEIEGIADAASALVATSAALDVNARRTEALAADVAHAALSATENVETVAGAAEELSASVREISAMVTRSSADAEAAVARTDATRGDVERLEDAAASIGDVVKLISEIAEQTNLLALNATIEAARAGEAGKGFAVVAGEVKNLANQTGSATQKISEQIGAVQSLTQSAAGAMRDVGAAITQLNATSTSIAAAVEEQGATTMEIARNVEQAASGARHVSDAIAQVAQGASETQAKATSGAAAADDVAAKAESMRNAVGDLLSEARRVV
ncbi:MAG: methyl-accepting chemotaxis protein [Pseudomonadota bacterium]